MKYPWAERMIRYNTKPSTGMATINTRDSLALRVNAMIREKIIIIGALTSVRMIIMYAICTFVISVVIRVTRLAVENLSIFWNEKS